MRNATRLLVAVLMSLIIMPFTARAQVRISAVGVGSGQDPISSGISAFARFETLDSTKYGELVFQQEQAWITWGPALKGKIKGFVNASVGHFQGEAWVGPYAVFSVPLATVAGKELSLGTLQWPVFFLTGEPRDWKTVNDGVRNPENLKIGYLGLISVTWGPVTVSHGWLNFMDDPWNKLPGASLTIPITGEVTTTSSFTWDSNAGRALLFMGASWSPRRGLGSDVGWRRGLARPRRFSF